MSPDGRNPYRPLVIAGVLLAVIFLLYVARNVLIPIALGILLTFILTPLVGLLQARGLRRVYAVVLVVLCTVVLVGGLVTAVMTQLRDLARDLPGHKGHIIEKVRDLTGRGPGVLQGLNQMAEDIGKEISGPSKDTPERPVPVAVTPDRNNFGLLALLAGPLASTLGSLGLTLALTVSMLLMREDLRNRLLLLLGDGNLTSTTRALDEVSFRISRYLLIQLSINAAFGALFGVGLALIGVPYAFLWAVMAAVLRFVPYIGTWLAAVFPVLVSLADAGWGQTLFVLGYAVLLGIGTNNVVEPLLVSRSTGVTPIALVVTTAFWTWLWGPIGLILATPMTVCLSVLGRHVPSLSFLNVVLGAAAPLGDDLKFYQRLLARDEVEAADLLEAYLAAHPPEELFDNVLTPALARASADRARGHLSDAELADLVRTTRELTEAALHEPNPAAGEPVVLLGCPAHHEAEGLALEVFARVLGPVAHLELARPDATASDVLARVDEAQPALVCLSVLPPGGAARARYLCKRLRARYPRLPIVAAAWGGEGLAPGLADQLRVAGATHVTATFAETRAQVVPLLQVAPLLEPAGAAE